MTGLTWWLRVVGALYVLVAFVAIVPRVPIRAEGPPGILERAAERDPTARFVIDTWLMFGLYVGAIGASLLVASWFPAEARGLAWTVIAVELIGGIGIDVYKIVRGYRRDAPIVWIVIHSLVIVSGVIVLR